LYQTVGKEFRIHASEIRGEAAERIHSAFIVDFSG